MVQGVSNSIELIENELTFDDRNPLYSFVALFREIIVLKCSQYWSLSQSSGNMNTSQAWEEWPMLCIRGSPLNRPSVSTLLLQRGALQITCYSKAREWQQHQQPA